MPGSVLASDFLHRGFHARSHTLASFHSSLVLTSTPPWRSCAGRFYAARLGNSYRLPLGTLARESRLSLSSTLRVAIAMHRAALAPVLGCNRHPEQTRALRRLCPFQAARAGGALGLRGLLLVPGGTR